MNLSESISTATQLSAKHVYLTHLSHELDVYQTLGELAEHFQFAYDGMKLTFPADASII